MQDLKWETGDRNTDIASAVEAVDSFNTQYWAELPDPDITNDQIAESFWKMRGEHPFEHQGHDFQHSVPVRKQLSALGADDQPELGVRFIRYGANAGKFGRTMTYHPRALDRADNNRESTETVADMEPVKMSGGGSADTPLADEGDRAPAPGIPGDPPGVPQNG